MIRKIPILVTLVVMGLILSMGSASATIVLDGSTFDGDHDEVQINVALAQDDVYLDGCYAIIGDPVLINVNGRTLSGNLGSTIKLENNSDFTTSDALIKVMGADDVTVTGFCLDGNRAGNTQVSSGAGYHNLIYAEYADNLTVTEMDLSNNHGDGLKARYCNDLVYSYNVIYSLGHDGLYAIGCNGVTARYNSITLRTNSGLRLYNSNNVLFEFNDITGVGYGGAGIEIQKYGSGTMNNIEVCDNFIRNTRLSGIWIFGSNTYPVANAYVNVHDNDISGCGYADDEINGGILSNGFSGLLQRNTIGGCYGGGIIQRTVYSPAPTASGFVITLDNNDFFDIDEEDQVINDLNGTHSFVYA
jgi:hypothetical protein